MHICTQYGYATVDNGWDESRNVLQYFEEREKLKKKRF